jgi:hypothetical protein
VDHGHRKLLLPLISTGAGEAALSTAWTIAQVWNTHMAVLHVQMDLAPADMRARVTDDLGSVYEGGELPRSSPRPRRPCDRGLAAGETPTVAMQPAHSAFRMMVATQRLHCCAAA